MSGRLELLFDLDGTLTDPADGITACIQHSLRELGRPVPGRAQLLRFIGPPLRSTFLELLEDAPDQVDRAIALYRERYGRIGMLENRLYPDVPAMLETLASRGHRLRVATSKPTVFARRIVEHFGIGRWFGGVHGSELDGRNADKRDLLAEVIRSERLAPGNTWMIGDRSFDVRAARSHGLGAIAVSWGYGSREELAACAPDAIVGSMAELLALAAR